MIDRFYGENGLVLPPPTPISPNIYTSDWHLPPSEPATNVFYDVLFSKLNTQYLSPTLIENGDTFNSGQLNYRGPIGLQKLIDHAEQVVVIRGNHDDHDFYEKIKFPLPVYDHILVKREPKNLLIHHGDQKQPDGPEWLTDLAQPLYNLVDKLLIESVGINGLLRRLIWASSFTQTTHTMQYAPKNTDVMLGHTHFPLELPIGQGRMIYNTGGAFNIKRKPPGDLSRNFITVTDDGTNMQFDCWRYDGKAHTITGDNKYLPFFPRHNKHFDP